MPSGQHRPVVRRGRRFAEDRSTALEILGFAGAEAREGLASHLEKRKPAFSQDCPI